MPGAQDKMDVIMMRLIYTTGKVQIQGSKPPVGRPIMKKAHVVRLQPRKVEPWVKPFATHIPSYEGHRPLRSLGESRGLMSCRHTCDRLCHITRVRLPGCLGTISLRPEEEPEKVDSLLQGKSELNVTASTTVLSRHLSRFCLLGQLFLVH